MQNNISEHARILISVPFDKKNKQIINPLNAELNPICPFLTLFGAHHIFDFSRLRVNNAAGTVMKTRNEGKKFVRKVFQENTF